MILIFNRYITLALLLALVSLNAAAQEPAEVKRSENKVILEGKIYYVHVVKSGNTLYALSKAYNVPEKEIIIENPGVTSELRIGQVLKIPFRSESSFNIDTGKIQEGKMMHKIREGETLYSISRLHGCSVDDILQINPAIDINDIPIGTEIILPSGDTTGQNELSYDEEGFILHKVKKGETLYSISRFYKVSVREIKAINAELQWGQVRTGDVLKIPRPNNIISEVFRPDTVKFETMVPTGEDSVVPSEPYSYKELKEMEYRPVNGLKIAYLIPFEYRGMEPLDSLLKDVRSAIRRERITEDYLIEQATPKSVGFLEFLEGSLLALDSLSESGVYMDIRVYDTKKSMFQTRQILEKPEMKDMDLIIGPFYASNLGLVSDFTKKHKIPLVTPFHSDDSLLYTNPYLFQVTPSFKTEYERNADYIGRCYDRNLIIVHDGDSSKIPDIEYYKSKIFSELDKYSALETAVFKEVVISNGETDELVHALNPDTDNFVILPTTDEAFASQIASTLYYQLDSFNIELFGSAYWQGFNNIEISYIHALKLKISSCYRYDYSDPDLLWFLYKYRQNYFKEPEHYTGWGANFGVTGYDISLYFISALQKYGRKFLLHLDDLQVDGTMCDYQFRRVSQGGGYKNILMHYFLFDEGLVVQNTSLPERPPVHQYLRPAGEDAMYYFWSRPFVDTTAVQEEEIMQ
ncbi:MAG: LysM peptidoglycan-binding domain-containing protein [Bacteroidales bacterium]|nr:LysM peptidoglycan-binding domain-containing protein [Bacteroidales bacterium]